MESIHISLDELDFFTEIPANEAENLSGANTLLVLQPKEGTQIKKTLSNGVKIEVNGEKCKVKFPNNIVLESNGTCVVGVGLKSSLD